MSDLPWFTVAIQVDLEAPDLETAQADVSRAFDAIAEALPQDRSWGIHGPEAPRRMENDE